MKKLEIPTSQIISYGFVIILVIGNIAALVCIIQIFNQITQNKGVVSQTAQISQIQPFNASLYTQLQKIRSSKQLYTAKSSIQSSSVPEVFGSN